jgi:hypothetical protein
MIPNFIGVNEKFVNLYTIALIEDESTENESVAKITTSDGAEIELVGTDADIIFERVEMFAKATDELLLRLQQGSTQ